MLCRNPAFSALVRAHDGETIRSPPLLDSPLLPRVPSLKIWGVGAGPSQVIDLEPEISVLTIPPSLPPLINYIHKHIYLPCNMENSYSYLGFSGLTLINVICAMAPRGAPPDESCPIKFQLSLWMGLCQKAKTPERERGRRKDRERAGWPLCTGALGPMLAFGPRCGGLDWPWPFCQNCPPESGNQVLVLPAALFPSLLNGTHRPEAAWLLPAKVWVGPGPPAGG